MAAAIAITTRRMDARGQDGDFVMDAALLAIPLGIIGARLYPARTRSSRARGSTASARRA
jgi:prolipoprotein diacylglyceryltransferase